MTKYQVEEFYGDTVVSSGIVVENDPMKAAEAAARQQRVSPRALQGHWFRVVDEDQAADAALYCERLLAGSRAVMVG
ncbi:hypothetical protein LB543_24555 [Mesorhizobium sp. ESP7-2]|uniref:hypothetical protein n=1 Tax=Mesorhizobium sp. ESP7-2 TaxID=2876622 RepID=UPI001CCF6096|nr:hypothetical protein [Mesorhizobium sp. ESP7-2]MBZ9709880.1 hypothetical protein [Mesorhizobium sp. ESP7-2]